jgi:photosystem II stability/assembly factor-like uncharacterized protein
METKIFLATAHGVNVIAGSGENWHGETRLKDKQVQCVAAGMNQPERVYCGSLGEGVFRSDDGGATWCSCGGLGDAKVIALALSENEQVNASGVVYAGTEPSAIFRSENAGETWHRLPTFLNLPSASEWSFPPRPETHHVRYILPDLHVPGRLHVAIEAGALLRSDDAGQTWRDRVPGGPKDTHTLAMHPGAPSRLYSAAGDGYFESTDGGDSWRRISEGLKHSYCWSVVVSQANPDTILVTASRSAREAHTKGSAGSLVYRRAEGESWHEVWNGLPNPQERRIAVVAASTIEPDLFYLSSEDEVYRSADGGVEWQLLRAHWPEGSRPERALNIAIVERG